MKGLDLYWYEIKEVVSVYDGDTLTVTVDLGFQVNFTITVRLFGIDTPELRGNERIQGLWVRDYVRDRLSSANVVTMRSIKDRTGKYGRYLAEIFVDGESLNEELMEIGMADPYAA